MKKKNGIKLLLSGVFLVLFSMNAFCTDVPKKTSLNKVIRKTISVPIPPEKGPSRSMSLSIDLTSPENVK